MGAMLPDVWRMADRRAHTRRLDRDAPVPDEESTERRRALDGLTEGVTHHLAIDAWFHGTEVFVRGERAARLALRRAEGAPKVGLFAHVAWELCLDGALLRRFGLEPMLEAIRASIASVRPDLHHRAADVHVAPRVRDRALFESRVDEILDAIARGPWVSGYATAEGIVERLEGVRARLGFAPMEGCDREAAASGLRSLEGEADAGLDAIHRSAH
jgi:hypothetical protein